MLTHEIILDTQYISFVHIPIDVKIVRNVLSWI